MFSVSTAVAALAFSKLVLSLPHSPVTPVLFNSTIHSPIATGSAIEFSARPSGDPFTAAVPIPSGTHSMHNVSGHMAGDGSEHSIVTVTIDCASGSPPAAVPVATGVNSVTTIPIPTAVTSGTSSVDAISDTDVPVVTSAIGEPSSSVVTDISAIPSSIAFTSESAAISSATPTTTLDARSNNRRNASAAPSSVPFPRESDFSNTIVFTREPSGFPSGVPVTVPTASAASMQHQPHSSGIFVGGTAMHTGEVGTFNHTGPRTVIVCAASTPTTA